MSSLLMLFTAPVSAFAARKARQQQAQIATAPKSEPEVQPAPEHPSKRPRRSLDVEQPAEANGRETRGLRTRSSKKQDAPSPTDKVKGHQGEPAKSQPEEPQVSEVEEDTEEESSEVNAAEDVQEMSEDEVASVAGDADGFESPTETPAELQNFPLSKSRLNKKEIVYADANTLCVRIKERMVRVNVLEFVVLC
jgi:polynucleotide 5'-hydroxyl-kinase GRC3/NOL9